MFLVSNTFINVECKSLDFVFSQDFNITDWQTAVLTPKLNHFGQTTQDISKLHKIPSREGRKLFNPVRFQF